MVLTSAGAPLGVSGQTPSKALSKNQIVDLLKGGVPSTRVEALVRQNGVTFGMTHAISTQLRQTGASDSLMKALWQLSSGRSSPGATAATGGTAQPPAPAGSPPILQIEVTPGGAQVYIDDELLGSTSSQGRLKLSQLTPGQHDVRLALPGYHDYEQNVTLVAGQTAAITATLQDAKATMVVPPVTTSVTTPAAPGAPATPQGKPSLTGSKMATFYVAHDHGKGGETYCMGWLSVGNGKVEFRSTSEPSHSFSYPLMSLKDYGPNDRYMKKLGGFHVRIKDLKDGIFNFAAVSSTGQFQPPSALWKAFRNAQGLEP